MRYKILIWAVLAMGFFSVALAVVVGIRMRDKTVNDDPFDAAIHYDQDRKTVEELGLKTAIDGKFVTGENDLNVRLTLKDENAVKNVKLTASVSMFGSPDTQNYDLKDMGHGSYHSRVLFAKRGYWDVDTIVNYQGRPLRFENRVYVE